MGFLKALVLSLIVHLLLVLILDRGAPYFEPKPIDVTSIELIETPSKEVAKKPSQQVVRQADLPKSELQEDETDLARFLSADKQRVRKETQAAITGMTRNRSSAQKSAPNNNQSKNNPAADPRQISPKDYDPEGMDIAKNFREYAQSNDIAPSTVGESLPQDVSVGSFTALNTDRYTYYSFFARIEDLIRFRWESRVRQAIDTYDRSYILGVIGRKSWVTSLDIWITKDGRFHSAHLLKESGIQRFDQAAILAFKEAAMFPNPPQEMVEEDGYIHLRYSFNVRFSPSSVVYSQ